MGGVRGTLGHPIRGLRGGQKPGLGYGIYALLFPFPSRPFPLPGALGTLGRGYPGYKSRWRGRGKPGSEGEENDGFLLSCHGASLPLLSLCPPPFPLFPPFLSCLFLLLLLWRERKVQAWRKEERMTDFALSLSIPFSLSFLSFLSCLLPRLPFNLHPVSFLCFPFSLSLNLSIFPPLPLSTIQLPLFIISIFPLQSISVPPLFSTLAFPSLPLLFPAFFYPNLSIDSCSPHLSSSLLL